jgi:hypothetical protein
MSTRASESGEDPILGRGRVTSRMRPDLGDVRGDPGGVHEARRSRRCIDVRVSQKGVST